MVRLMEEIRRSPVEVGSLSHYLQGFIYPRWCRISAINSMKKVTPYKQFEVHPRKITNVPFSKGPGLKRKPDHLPTTVFHRTCEVSGGGGGGIHVKLQDSISNMGVSKNRGTPKSSILIGFSIIFTIHFGVPPIFGLTPIFSFSVGHPINSL